MGVSLYVVNIKLGVTRKKILNGDFRKQLYWTICLFFTYMCDRNKGGMLCLFYCIVHLSNATKTQAVLY